MLTVVCAGLFGLAAGFFLVDGSYLSAAVATAGAMLCAWLRRRRTGPSGQSHSRGNIPPVDELRRYRLEHPGTSIRQASAALRQR